MVYAWKFFKVPTAAAVSTVMSQSYPKLSQAICRRQKRMAHANMFHWGREEEEEEEGKKGLRGSISRLQM